MNLEIIREYALSKPFTDEALPFGEDTLVFRVMEKAFLLTGFNQENFSINLKAEPEYVIELRERYPSIRPGFHMNKKYWNTILVDELDNWKLLQSLIDHSYEQVVLGLAKYKQNLIKECLADK